jgi:hypothetical protein
MRDTTTAARSCDLAQLRRFTARQSDDDVKDDLELTCEDCDEHLCDVEAGDSLETLARMTLDHYCE